ncbi:hypothetical protein KPH14_011613 [Odynerus spinipes]|uniref:Reverse transcriptase domain-containing protein n=1 Tax=Odynerus spinipes TaxID=1348599 RepID=A0AAD9VLH9_9HYME|nr:hypothetical protein KPH14_011613 [Odynerus spinipes]
MVREGIEMEGEEGEEEDIKREEIVKVLMKLKEGKAPGEDGLENEVWKKMPMEVGEALEEVLRRIWRREKIPKEWKKGVICPVFKKGVKGMVENYRGITLMDTAYKIYAGILHERLMAKVEGKLQKGQYGFRRGRGTMDAVFVLNT